MDQKKPQFSNALNQSTLNISRNVLKRNRDGESKQYVANLTPQNGKSGQPTCMREVVTTDHSDVKPTGLLFETIPD